MTEPTAEQLPAEVMPQDGNPNLQPYAQWRQDEDKGARLAHDDAKLPEAQRTPQDAVAAQGPAFYNGYQRHTADLRDAGMIL